MDYAVIGKNAFVTSGNIQTKKSLPHSVLKRQAFLRRHDFQVSIDPGTKKVNIKITDK